MKSKIAFAAVMAMLGLASMASAAIITITGDTTGGPTFNRPLADLTALSTVGTAVPYKTLTFTVSVAGTYTFLTTGAFDTFDILYSPAFNPASSLSNAVVANDDLLPSSQTTSGFEPVLAVGTTYVLVTTGFANTDFGFYSTTIGGPGVVTTVPEPAGLVAATVGFAALAYRRRSR